MESLFHFIYTSIANTHFQRADLPDLMDQCRANNKINGLSGILLFHSGVFIQWLEGFESNVNTLRRILHNDDRHYGMVEIEHGPISQRYFSSWSMGFLESENICSNNGTSFSAKDLSDLTQVPTKPWLAVDVLFRQAQHFRSHQKNENSKTMPHMLQHPRITSARLVGSLHEI